MEPGKSQASPIFTEAQDASARIKIAFYYDMDDPVYNRVATRAIEAARRHMTECPIVHVSAGKRRIDPKLPEVDWRLHVPVDGEMSLRRFLAQSHLKPPVLFLDVDCILQDDVSHVFDLDFDMALTRRNPEDRVRPYNAGVMFCKNVEYFKDLYWYLNACRYEHMEIKIGEFVKQNTKYRIVDLDGGIYNYSPATESESLEGRKIVHYKGSRKKWIH